MAVLDKLRTEKMNSAAVTVQRYARGWLTRRLTKRFIQTIRVLQSAVRARTARLELRALRREKVAPLPRLLSAVQAQASRLPLLCAELLPGRRATALFPAPVL
jgi:hypothetical protein